MRSAHCTWESRSASRLVRQGLGVLASLALALALTPNLAVAQDMAFGLGNTSNNIPTTFAGVNYTNRLVIYDLPASGPYAAVAGTADGHIDVFATINGAASRQAAAYGMIMTLAGTGTRFIAATPSGANPPNNLPSVMNPTRTQNAGMSAVFGDLNVDGQPAGGLSIGVAGIHPTPNADVTVANNDGLIAIPIDVDAGLATGPTRVADRAISFILDPEYSGFVNTANALLTNTNNFPHVGGTLQIRQSRPGDTDGNGLINGFDISGFVSVLADATAYQNARPWMRVRYISDFDGNNLINGFDIPGFVAALSAGSPDVGPAAVPEPATWSLVAMVASLGLVVARRRRR